MQWRPSVIVAHLQIRALLQQLFRLFNAPFHRSVHLRSCAIV